jgi:putative ABC transport system substrate-binding protein
MSYSADFHMMNKQVAAVVDKVLRGRKPSDLPVEYVTAFRLTINAKAASLIGLTLSPLLLARADEIIE